MPPKPPFFPNPGLAWIFCGLLVSFVIAAAYIDTKRAIVPNKLTVSGLAIGLVLNVIRSAWLGAENKPLWWLDSGTVWLGALDGLLFALIGFAVAFLAFLGIWILGYCGGGDVKLFAALGAWFGVEKWVIVWLLSVVALLLWTFAKVLANGFRPSKIQSTIKKMQKAGQAAKDGSPPRAGRQKIRVTYSLPIAIASILACMWFFRVDLGFVPPSPPSPSANSVQGSGDGPTPPTQSK